VEAIRYYVKGVFRDVIETPQVLEQQEELIADMTAKVDDLVAEGKPADEALGLAIASVGDLSALIAEFKVEQQDLRVEGLPRFIPTARVEVGRLDFHATAITVGIEGALMLVASILARDAIERTALLMVFLAIAIAGLWLAAAFRRLRNENEIETRELQYLPRILKTTGIALAVSVVAFLANLGLGAWDFWVWPIWVAAMALPMSVIVERQLIRSGWFLAEDDEPTAGAVN
jgi:hypothetical protein